MSVNRVSFRLFTRHPMSMSRQKGKSVMNRIEICVAFAARGIGELQCRVRKTFARLLALCAALGWCASAALAQPGSLDIATFGPYAGLAYGIRPDTSAHFFRMHDAIVLPDDRIVASGTCVATGATPAGTRFCLVVWTASGGTATIYVHSTSVNRVSANEGGAIAAQPDGKIVATAPCIYQAIGTVTQFCTVRFNADFTPDTTFAVGFQNVAPSASTSGDGLVNAIAIQPDGKIVIAGQCSSMSGTFFCASRVLANGTPESTFGGGSSLRTFLGVNSTNALDRVRRIALSTTGLIYLGGDCKQNSSTISVGCVARLLPDGSVDNTFTATPTPLLLTNIGDATTSDFVFDMVVQANGEVVFAGACGNTGFSTSAPCVQRLVLNTLCPTCFGTRYPGATVVSPSGAILVEPSSAFEFASISRVYLQHDGKMLALLTITQATGTTSQRVRRYNEDGSIDKLWEQPYFDFETPASAPSSRALALGQQRSGKVIAMGVRYSSTGFQPEGRIIRLNNNANPGRNCSADIDGDGKVLPTTDGLLLARASLGLTGSAVVSGATGAGAPRNTWEEVRDFLITQCGMQTIRP
jgi:uncharacterized delta-60 repeat protein